MTRRLEDQIRTYAQAIYAEAHPIEELISGEMAEDFGLEVASAPVEVVVTRRVRKRLPGWLVGALTAAAVLLISLPVWLWLGDSEPDALAPPEPAGVVIAGLGTVEITYGESDVETISFSVTARGGEPIYTEEIPAIGRLEVSTVEPFAGAWQAEGPVVCVRDLSPFPEGDGGVGVWEIRFAPSDSTNEALPVGRYASLYVRDLPGGDSAGMLISTDNGSSCGPRSGIDLRPLLSGAIEVND